MEEIDEVAVYSLRDNRLLLHYTENDGAYMQ